MYLTLLKTIWARLYQVDTNVDDIVHEYFHPEYEQCINGITMNRSEYIVHVQEQKKNVVIEHIDYKHTIEKGEEVFGLYYPRGKNTAHMPIEAEVVAYFQFKEQLLYRIHGMVRLLRGNLMDVDM